MTHTLHYGPCLLIGESPFPEAHQATLALLWQSVQVPQDARHVKRFLSFHIATGPVPLYVTTLN